MEDFAKIINKQNKQRVKQVIGLHKKAIRKTQAIECLKVLGGVVCMFIAVYVIILFAFIAV